jgi:hypothetical protein
MPANSISSSCAKSQAIMMGHRYGIIKARFEYTYAQ